MIFSPPDMNHSGKYIKMHLYISPIFFEIFVNWRQSLKIKPYIHLVVSFL